MASDLLASGEDTIAVLEFQNRSAAVRYNGNDMANRMANDLKKHGRFKPGDRKAVGKILDKAKWIDERLSVEDETRLRELPAKYVLYGSIVDWRSSVDSLTKGEGISPQMKSKVAVNGVLVVLDFNLVNLDTGTSVKSFQTEGAGMGEARGMGDPAGSSAKDFADFDEMFEEAWKTAVVKAASILSEKE